MHFTFASLCTQLLAVLGLAVMDVDMTVDLAAGPGPGSAATAGTAHSKAARPKGRLPHQVRTYVSERAVLHRADGSAKWTQENSIVLAAVYGPRQAKVQKEDAEKAVVEIVFKPRSGMQGPLEREYELLIRSTLESVVPLAQHPRTSIMVVLQVLQADGSLLSCALNAACAALVDAGVAMKTMFAAISLCVDAHGGLVLDPEAEEEQAARALISLAYPFHYDFVHNPEGTLLLSESTLLSYAHGAFSSDQLFDALEIGHEACKRIAKFHRQALVRSLQAVA